MPAFLAHPAQSTALAAIGLYQRHLSPRKGFCCAHRVLHGGTGCSGYAKAQIRDLGLWRALPLIRARFAACGDAADALYVQRGGDPALSRRERRAEARAQRRRDRHKERCCDACECGGYSLHGCIDAIPLLRACGPAAKSDISSCDGDVGGCDCGDFAGGCAP